MSGETCADCVYLFHVDGQDRWLPVCRRRSPTSKGWPIVRSIDRCGEFKSRDEGPKVTKLGQEPDEFGRINPFTAQYITHSQLSILKRISDAGKKMHKDCPQIVMAFTRAEVESIGDV